MSVTKYFFSIMGALCAWLFAVLVIDFNDFLDVPMFVYALILAVLISAAHVLATRRFGNPGPKDATLPIMVKLFVLGFLALVATIIAALGLSAAINADYRAELSAPFVTCAEDYSRIKTISVDKELVVDGGTITLHSIKTNVPQSAKNPQAYAYTCQKALLADISVISDAGGEALQIRDLELVTTNKPTGITADELNSSSQFSAYATSEKLGALRQSRLSDSQYKRGWVAFPMDESDNSTLKKFVYDQYSQNKSIDLN